MFITQARFDAASWTRMINEVAAADDLPAEPI
jgi:hypothetical protein